MLDPSKYEPAMARAAEKIDPFRKTVEQAFHDLPAADKVGETGQRLQKSLGLIDQLETQVQGFHRANPAELTSADVKAAIEFKEITARGYGNGFKADLERSGYKFDRVQIPGFNEPQWVVPGSNGTLNPLDAVTQRGTVVAHNLSVPPDSPAAIDAAMRRQQGMALHSQLEPDASGFVQKYPGHAAAIVTVELHPIVQAKPETEGYSPTAIVAANDGFAGQPMTDVADGGGKSSAAKFMPRPNPLLRPAPTGANETAPTSSQPAAAHPTSPMPHDAPSLQAAAEAAQEASHLRTATIKGGLIGAGISAVVRGGVTATTGADGATVAEQAGRGALDAAIPGLGDGFSGIRGNDPNRPVNWVDRGLNTLDTATGTVATGSLVVAVPTGGTALLVTGVAGLANVGVNLLHDATYKLDLSQEGGIITGGKNIVTTLTHAYKQHHENSAGNAEALAPVQQFSAATAPQTKEPDNARQAAGSTDGTIRDAKLAAKEIAAGMVRLGVSTCTADNPSGVFEHEAIAAQRVPSVLQGNPANAGRQY